MMNYVFITSNYINVYLMNYRLMENLHQVLNGNLFLVTLLNGGEVHL